MKTVRRKGWRKKWELPLTEDQLRMKIRRMAGKQANYRPHPDKAIKSTKFGIMDICLIARVDQRGLYYFLAGKERPPPGKAGNPCGQDALKRINETIDLIRGGYVTKSQIGVYHFHDEPAVAPMKEMRVNLMKGVITGEVLLPPKPVKFPDFGKLFGG